MEGIGLAFKKAQVGVHAGAWQMLERLRHEGGAHVGVGCHLFDYVPEGHDVISHGQHVRMAQINFLLPRCGFVMAKLRGNSQ